MPAEIINGRDLAAQSRAKVSQDVADMIARGIHPGLTVILVGEDPASQIYVGLKEKACREVGIESHTFRLPADTPEEKLLGLIRDLNQDPRVHGILVQVPLPPPLREKVLLEAIDPLKDVDCFHPTNVGRLVEGKPYLLPCTPAGIMEMIRSTGVDPQGKEAVVVGRSNIVGKPTAQLLLAANATVTVAHSRTRNLAEVCRRADILVAAVGKPALIRGEWIKPGAVVIDVGMNRIDGKVVGDVAYDEALPVAGYITPVPGGVGPMTIAMLMQNVARAAQAISGE